MKFEVGNKVRINPDCKVGHIYGGLTLLDNMKFEGVATIKNIEVGGWFNVDLEGYSYYSYSKEMFELASGGLKYKVGDRVRVRSDLTGLKRYKMESPPFYDEVVIRCMEDLKGKVVTITSTSDFGYHIKEESCNWTDEMFEGLADEEPKKVKANLKVGDRVKLRKDLRESWTYDDEPAYVVSCSGLMTQHAGEFVTIKELCEVRDGVQVFLIEEKLKDCSDCYTWSADMLDLDAIENPLDMKLEIGVDVIPTIPIVVVPIVTDEFTAKWMKDFVKRNGGMAVNG